MSLRQISGKRIDGRSFPNFVWNADIIDIDGPLLSLYKNEDGTDTLFAWLDCDDRKNRWAIVPVSREMLGEYVRGSVSLRSVFLEVDSVITFDQSASYRKSNMLRVSMEEFPADYLPSAQSFLSPAIATDEAVRLAEEKATEYSIKLDGELYIEDLAAIPRLYQQLYSFHYGLEHLDRPAVKGALSNIMERWSGGFTAVNLFSGLTNQMPSIHRARLKTLQYNSPGFIKMDLLPKMADGISGAASRICDDSIFVRLEQLYKDVYGFFREHKLSGFEDDRRGRVVELSEMQNETLREYVALFLKLMSFQQYADKFFELDLRPLNQIRALLAYYRRLRKLRGYIKREMISLP